MDLKIYTAPPSNIEVALGRTLPSLLDESADDYPNPKAFNQPLAAGGWKTVSNGDFRTAANEIAAGIRAEGFHRGDHMAFLMDSDMYFAMCDFGTLIAGIVNAPLYVTYTEENLVFVTNHAEAKAMFVSNETMLKSFATWADQVADVSLVILAEGSGEGVALPSGVRMMTLDHLREVGRGKIAESPNLPDEMRDEIDAKDLATLIYTSGTTGQPKGVMLSHENISSNVMSALPTLGALGNQEETILTFLPMTHIFARTLVHAHVAWGHSLYFTNPDLLVGHLAEIQPTMFSTVPRVLEKVYDKVSLGVTEASGLKHVIGSWALSLAGQFDIGKPDGGQSGLKHGLADKLVYSKLRERLGLTRVKTVAVGGAALRPDLANSFCAFGIPVVQGYGLTETSPVITMNKPTANRAGTVGQPIPGVEVAIAEDGEILSRGPHIMMGYYKAPDLTDEVMSEGGWFHTGDIGEFTSEGFLKITDRKKALFKLSTGKYVIPQPIENALMEHALIEQAVVVGNGQKFASAIIFPGEDALLSWAKHKEHDVSGGIAAVARNPAVVKKLEDVVAKANKGFDHWNQVQRFIVATDPMTIDNDLLTPKMSVKRSAVGKAYADAIQRMYDAPAKAGHTVMAVV